MWSGEMPSSLALARIHRTAALQSWITVITSDLSKNVCQSQATADC
jgi:hypothetical protein